MYHKPSLQSLKVQHNTVKVKFSWHTFSHFQQVKYNNFGYFPINVLLQDICICYTNVTYSYIQNKSLKHYMPPVHYKTNAFFPVARHVTVNYTKIPLWLCDCVYLEGRSKALV